MRRLLKISACYAKVDWDEALSFRLDSEGRWCSARLGARFYQRTLRGDVIVDNRQLDDIAAERVERDIRRQLQGVRAELARGDLADIAPPAQQQLRQLLLRACEHPPSRPAIAQQFDQAYSELVPILPPDRYRDIVVLPATGCPNARCSFCAFYKDSPFRSRSLADFEQHLQLVRTLFGDSIAARDGVFLGSANALALPQKKILPVLASVDACLGQRKRGVASFFDPEHASRRSREDWCDLAGGGLSQVVIGLETGLASLRRALGKSDDLSLLQQAIADIRAAQIRVGLTLLVGAGDVAEAARQRDATAAFIQALELAAGDVIYLSPLKGCAWPELDNHYALFRRQLRAHTAAKVVHYSMDKFRYFA